MDEPAIAATELSSSHGGPLSPKPARRRRWLAAFLSLIFPGLGQVILGYPLKAFIWLLVQTALTALFCLSVYLKLPLLFWCVMAAFPCARIVPVWEAWRLSRREPFPARMALIPVVAVLITIYVLLPDGARLTVKASRYVAVGMYPAMHAGDLILAMQLWRTIERGDIVLFEKPDDPSRALVSRVVAVGGDEVEIRDGALIVNGVAADRKRDTEPCAPYCVMWVESYDGRTRKIAISDSDSVLPQVRTYGPETIPPDHLFMLGDNRDNSLDSRFFGPVARSGVLGKPSFVYWSSEQDYSVPLEETFFRNIRWDRFNHVIE